MSSEIGLFEWISVGEVSRQFGIPAVTLNYWHNMGIVPAYQAEKRRRLFYNSIMLHRLRVFLELREMFSAFQARKIMEVLQRHDLVPWRPCDRVIREAARRYRRRPLGSFSKKRRQALASAALDSLPKTG